jgi:hypothetical protein
MVYTRLLSVTSLNSPVSIFSTVTDYGQKRAQTFENGYSKIQKIKEFSVLTLFYVIHY